MNINSFRHKCYPLGEALEKNVLDMLCVQETKLDDSFLMYNFKLIILNYIERTTLSETVVF